MCKSSKILIALIFLLTGCKTPPVITNDILNVGITPNLTFFQPAILRCSSQLSIHTLITEMPFNSIDLEEYDLVIHMGRPLSDAVFSTQVGITELIIITNPGNAVSQITLDDLAKILLGIHTAWQEFVPQSFPASTPVHVWTYPQGDDVRELIEVLVLNGRLISAANHLVPDSQAMLEAVTEDPSAIGFILSDLPHSGVKNLTLNQVGEISLSQPILASVASEPEGATKVLLNCLSQLEK